MYFCQKKFMLHHTPMKYEHNKVFINFIQCYATVNFLTTKSLLNNEILNYKNKMQETVLHVTILKAKCT